MVRIMSDVSDAIDANAQGPKSASGDAGSVTQHSLADQIEADRYLRSQAAAESPKRGFNIAKFRPNGSE